MWIIVDTNQISYLPAQINSAKLDGCFEGITIPAHVFAEILLRKNPVPSLERLRNFNIRFGMESGEVMNALGALSEAEIKDFTPFPGPGTEFARKYDDLFCALNGPSSRHIAWANKVKSWNREFTKKYLPLPAAFRKKARDAGISKIKSFDEALSKAGVGPTSFLGSIIMRHILRGRQGGIDISTQGRLYDAAMQNQHLARFLKAILCYLLSISRYWENQKLNYDPNIKRDDWPDVTIPLYASDGDVILTGDKKLSLTVRTIDPLSKITVMKCKDL